MVTRNLIDTAQKELDIFAGICDELKTVCECRTLKLYDVSFYCFKQMQKDFPLLFDINGVEKKDYFGMFCDDSYEFLLEGALTEERIKWRDVAKYIARTSTFRLCDEDSVVCLCSSGIDKESTFENIVEYNHGDWQCSDYAKDLKINEETLVELVNDGYSADVEDELTYIAEKLNIDFFGHIATIVEIDCRLREFFGSQVENFKEFLSEQEKEALPDKFEFEHFLGMKYNAELTEYGTYLITQQNVSCAYPVAEVKELVGKGLWRVKQ